MLTNIGKVHCVKEPVSGLYGCIDTPTNLLTNTRPINTVNNLINLVTKQCAKFLPIFILKCLFQLVRKLTDSVIKRKFLKHGTVVTTATASTTRTTRTAILVLITKYVQFIKSQCVTLDFLRSFLRCSPCAFRRVTPCLTYLLRSREGTFTCQSCKQLIDKVQQSYNLVSYKIYSRGKGVNNRCSHSTQRVLQVLCVCRKRVHTSCELSTHETTVLVEIAYTFLKSLRECRYCSTNRTIHSNSLKTAQ